MADLLQVGSNSPDVTFRQGREKVSLTDFLGDKNVVLAFYAAAFTGGWERELVGFQQKLDEFAGCDTEIIACSTDLYPAQRAFAEHCGVEFRMGSDFPGHQATKAFKVYDEQRETNRRVTYVIDKSGINSCDILCG